MKDTINKVKIWTTNWDKICSRNNIKFMYFNFLHKSLSLSASLLQGWTMKFTSQKRGEGPPGAGRPLRDWVSMLTSFTLLARQGSQTPAFVEKRRNMILSWSLAFNKSRTNLNGYEHKCLHRENYYQEEVGNIACPSGRIVDGRGQEKQLVRAVHPDCPKVVDR